MREQIKLTLTPDQIALILCALEEFDPQKVTSYELDEFLTGSDKEDYIVNIEETLTSARGY